MKRMLLVLAMAAVGVSAFAVPVEGFAEAREMAVEGETDKAFMVFAAIPGGEYAAVTVARGDAARFLVLIQADAELMESPRSRLIEAELLLASGRRDEAVEKFKTLADGIDWGAGEAGYYPVEPPGSSGEVGLLNPALHYSRGPGSHRDNWLLRRLIALELMDEAGREFARIWEIHRAKGFASLGLQFTLDYAYFLKRTDRTDESLDVLMEPLRVMNMDRNPNVAFPQRAILSSISHPGLVGVARKEFIRLAYGEFKNAGRADTIAGELQRQINQGENRARRVLAQVKLHEGATEAAFALELEYIEKGGFNLMSASYRRGLIFEANGMTDEAVFAFEQVLAADPQPLDVPDADERISESAMFGSIMPNGRDVDVEDRLQRLYAAQGRMDKVLELQFARFDANENTLNDLRQIEQMATRLKTAGQEERFNEWATGRLATAENPRARANLAWMIGDYPAAIRHADEAYLGYFHERHFWRSSFAKVDPNHELEYLRAIVTRHPADALARLELLDLEDNMEGLEAIAALETLLATGADGAFSTSRGDWSRTRFNGFLDLAYRLMRLYEKNNLLEKLRALGLEIAGAENLFGDAKSHGYEPPGQNGREEFGNACLALAIRHADDPAYQAELAAALETSRWVGARSQLARRAGNAPAPAAVGASPPWANLPRNTRVIVSSESVACVARGERFIYLGLPWGVAVHDANGAPVTRILLGTPATHLVAADDQLWVGTEAGMFCITAGKWSVTHDPVGEVVALGLDGDQLWIGVRDRIDNGVMVLNRHTLEMRTYSMEEIGINRTLDFTRFESDGESVWADNYFGLLRYERATDTWSAVENPEPRNPVHLIGIIDGQVWVDVWLNDELRRRPARLDRKTLEMTPLEMGGTAANPHHRMINSNLVFLGHHHGQPVFGVKSGRDRFVVEKESNSIRRLREAAGDDGPETISDPLPDAMAAIPADAWPDGLREGVRSTRSADRWPAGAVWAVLFDDARKQEWLCVGAGLAVMPRDGSALRHFGNPEGLTLGPMLDGVVMGGNLYFASAWDDHRGSLTSFDPKIGVFTPWFRSDGMDSDKVVGLAVKDGQLELRYGVDYPGDDTKTDLPPGRYDPTTGRFTSGGDERIAPVDGKRPAPAINGTLPVLGGPAYRSYHRGGKTWHCGERGLVIYPGTKAPALTFAPMRVRRIPSALQISREEAKKIEISDPIPAELLRELVKHPNPYVRFRAVKAAYHPLMSEQADDFAPILLDTVNDSFPSVRALSVWVLSQCKSPAAIPPLREALDDANPGIRAMATVAMARLGEMPPLEQFANVVKHSDRRSSFPFGEDSSFSVGASGHEVFTSLARHADRRIFEFLATLSPPNFHHTEPLYLEFGESLRKHPDAAAVLLAVQDEDRHGTWRNFVQFVFQHAGTEMLPILHEALNSEDRVVRSNAARACGAIGDESSIPHLMQALEMESGLTRASIVWALGELKAGEAVPRLIGLHQSERNAEQSRYRGAGMLALNAIPASQGEYTALSNLDSIESDWNELQVSTRQRPRHPMGDEELLTPEHILEAVGKIGGAGAQVFFRALAGSGNAADRTEAMRGLAQVDAAGREENVAILRNLATDPVREIRTGAWVSLHFLGEPGLEKVLRESDPAEREELLMQMKRLPGSLLDPMRDDLEALTTPPEATERTHRLARELKERTGASP